MTMTKEEYDELQQQEWEIRERKKDYLGETIQVDIDDDLAIAILHQLIALDKTPNEYFLLALQRVVDEHTEEDDTDEAV